MGVSETVSLDSWAVHSNERNGNKKVRKILSSPKRIIYRELKWGVRVIFKLYHQ